MSTDKEPLIFESKAFKNLPLFFKQLSSSTEVQKQFIDNPTSIISKFLLNDPKIPRTKISHSNKLIYSILSNKKFLKFALKFQQNIEKEIESIQDKQELKAFFNKNKKKFYSQIIKAILKTTDEKDPIHLAIKNTDPNISNNSQIYSLRRPADSLVVLIDTITLITTIFVIILIPARSVIAQVTATIGLPETTLTIGLPATELMNNMFFHLSREELSTIIRVMDNLAENASNK